MSCIASSAYNYCGTLSLESSGKRKSYDRSLHEPNRCELQTTLVNVENEGMEKRMKLYEHDDPVRQFHDCLGNIIQARVAQPHIKQFAEGMRMAFAAFPNKGPDVSVKTELVGLSADDADRVSSDYLHEWNWVRDMLRHLADMASDAQTYMKKDETTGPKELPGANTELVYRGAAAKPPSHAPAATPPPPGVCILSDPFPGAKTCRRFHAQLEGMDVPTPLPDFPPDILGMMYAALYKRHKDLEGIYDFSAVDINIVELHLTTILAKVLDDNKSTTGEALTDKQREEILVWTGWGTAADDKIVGKGKAPVFNPMNYGPAGEDDAQTAAAAPVFNPMGYAPAGEDDAQTVAAQTVAAAAAQTVAAAAAPVPKELTRFNRLRVSIDEGGARVWHGKYRDGIEKSVSAQWVKDNFKEFFLKRCETRVGAWCYVPIGRNDTSAPGLEAGLGD